MLLTAAQADYLVELFKVGLEEVAERVAVITEHSVTLVSPTVYEGNDVAGLAALLEADSTAKGAVAELPLSGGFDGSGLMFVQSPEDKAFADLLSEHGDDQGSRETALKELFQVLLEQYVVVMTDLLNLNIDYAQMSFQYSSLTELPSLSDACGNDSLCLPMSFVLSDLAIHCHIIFIHQPPATELLSTIKSALSHMGLEE